MSGILKLQNRYLTGLSGLSPLMSELNKGLTETDNPLVEALEMMYERCNKTLSKRVKSGIKKNMKDVPPEVQLAMAKFIYVTR